MSSLGVFAGARHVLRVQRRQHSIVMASRPRRERNVPVQARDVVVGARDVVVGLLTLVAVPAWVLYAAWQKTQATSEGSSWRWGFFAVIGVVIASGHLFQTTALSFSAREVLFLPDKASVLLGRLLRALPLLLGIGCAWAVGVWFCLRDEWSRQPIAVAAVCTMAALAPVARSVAVLLQRIVAPGAGSVLTPAFGVAVCAAYLFGPADWTVGTERVEVTAIVLFIALLLLAALLHGLWKTTRTSLREAWLDIARAPRAITIAVLLVPPVVWRDSVWLPVAAYLGAASIVVLMPIALRRVLRTVNASEAETRGAAIERASAHDRPRDVRAPRATPRPHRGRSRWRAAWRRHWLEWGIGWRDLRHPGIVFVFVVRHAGCIWLATVAAWMREPKDAGFAVAPGWISEPNGAGIAVAVGLLAPAFVASPVSERLYAWGVDLAAMARQRVVAVLVAAALPCLFAASAVATHRGWTEHRALVLVTLATAFLVRLGWRGFRARPESAEVGGIQGWLVVLAIPAAMFLPIVRWETVLAVAALAAVGLARRIAHWREPELLADLVAQRGR